MTSREKLNNANAAKRMTNVLGHSNVCATLSLSLSQVLTYNSLYIFKARGHPRQYTAFLASVQGKPCCFFLLTKERHTSEKPISIFINPIIICEYEKNGTNAEEL